MTLITRLNGGQHIQILQQYDRVEKKTLYHARKVDSWGRSESEFTPWCESYDEAVEKVKDMETKDMTPPTITFHNEDDDEP